MSHSWNAYKVFKSGKRAKAPVMTFDCDGGAKEVEQKFFTDILPGLNEKLSQYRFMFVRADEKQDRAFEQSLEEKKIFQRKVQVVLRHHLKKCASSVAGKKGATGCLMLSKETGWKWRWCAVAPATNNHYCNLTDGFDSYDEAMGWMQEQCRKM